jgi:hypothetical protein
LEIVIDGRIILKWTLNKSGKRKWNEFMWLKTGTSNRLLAMNLQVS